MTKPISTGLKAIRMPIKKRPGSSKPVLKNAPAMTAKGKAAMDGKLSRNMIHRCKGAETSCTASNITFKHI